MKLNLTNIVTGLLLVAVPALFGLLFSYENRISKLEGGTDIDQIASLETTLEELRQTELVSFTNELSTLRQTVNSLETMVQAESEPYIYLMKNYA